MTHTLLHGFRSPKETSLASQKDQNCVISPEAFRNENSQATEVQQRLVSTPKQKCRNENSRATKVQQRLVRTPKQKCRPIYAISNELDIRSCNESPNKLQLAFDHYFPVVLCRLVVLLIMLYDVGLAFEHSKAIEQ